MTRILCCAALAVALVPSPLAAQTSNYAKGQPKAATGTQKTSGGTPRSTYGPAAPARPARSTTDRTVRQASDTQPIQEPRAGQAAPRGPVAGPARPGDDVPQLPSWVPLAPEVEKWVDEVLATWEQESSQVHRYECTFQRWEFEPVFGPRDGKTPKSYATGVLKYQAPDKGLFRVESLKKYVPPKEGEKPTFETPKDEFGEHWVCDGINIFEFDNRQKKLIQRILPKEMQGQAIADGPLPFLFGAKAATIKQRYWIRPAEQPEGVKGEYWLEAWPKGRLDAGNFKFVVAVIAEKDFMPSKLSVYAPNYDPVKNPARMDYKFENRKATLKGQFTPQQLLIWRKDFYAPTTPLGWTLERQDMNEPPPVAKGAKAPSTQATRPKSGLKTK